MHVAVDLKDDRSLAGPIGHAPAGAEDRSEGHFALDRSNTDKAATAAHGTVHFQTLLLKINHLAERTDRHARRRAGW